MINLFELISIHTISNYKLFSQKRGLFRFENFRFHRHDGRIDVPFDVVIHLPASRNSVLGNRSVPNPEAKVIVECVDHRHSPSIFPFQIMAVLQIVQVTVISENAPNQLTVTKRQLTCNTAVPRFPGTFPTGMPREVFP